MKIENRLLRHEVERFKSTTVGTFGLYRYPAKFIPQVIGFALEHYAKPSFSVLDPFAGCGTTGLVARLYGHDYMLLDINPMMPILHDIAVLPYQSVDAQSMLNRIMASNDHFLLQWKNIAYWHHDAFLPILSAAWGYYHNLDDIYEKSLLTVPLLKTTRKFSYDDIERQKLSKSPKSAKRVSDLLARDYRMAFFNDIKRNLDTVIKQIIEYQGMNPYPVNASIHAPVDTLSFDLDRELDMIITSPPYLQAQEYMRQAKMDLYWLGFSEADIKASSQKELPYRHVDPCDIYSETWQDIHAHITDESKKKVFERYFHGLLGALTRMQEKIRHVMCFFVGPANINGNPVPIDRILTEHFVHLDWHHEVTVVDTIVSRRMFMYKNNPAKGVPDDRMKTESLVVLVRK